MQEFDHDLRATEFFKRCRDECGMSSATFYRLLEEGEKAGVLHQSPVDKKWEVVKKGAKKS
jgi:hypothetical protein